MNKVLLAKRVLTICLKLVKYFCCIALFSVEALSVPDTDVLCGNEVVSQEHSGFGDAVRRNLLVEVCDLIVCGEGRGPSVQYIIFSTSIALILILIPLCSNRIVIPGALWFGDAKSFGLGVYIINTL